MPWRPADATCASSNLNGFNTSVGSLAGGGTSGGSVTLGSSTLTIGNDNTNTSFGGAITGSGSLVKQGTGVQTITSSVAYTGPTTVRGGTLSVQGSLAGTTAVNVNNGGTLLLGGTNNVTGTPALNLGGATAGNLALANGSTAAAPFSQSFGALTLSQNSTIDFGTGTNATFNFTSLTLDATPATAFNSLTITHYSGSASSNTDLLFFTSNPNLTDAQLANVNFYNDANALIANGGRQIAFGGGYEIVPIPEPSTLYSALAAVALISLRERRRFRRLTGAGK